MNGIMEKNTINNRLSIYRKPLMGLAILWIFMLHSGKTGNAIWDGVRVFGWAGVDAFFFLSAIGLCFSLKKDDNIQSFFRRRLIRILPTWLIVLFIVHMVGIVCMHILPGLPFYIPDSLIKCFTWYTGTGFWISDFVVGKGWFYEWYVPSLLMFYAVTPWLFQRNNKILICLLSFFLVLGLFPYHYQVLNTTHFFYHRIPIFILGILFGHIIINEYNIKKFNLLLLSCFLLSSIIIGLHFLFNIDIPKEYVALFLCPPCLTILTFIVSQKYICDFLSFFGGISLELYLIHLYRRPHYLMSFFFDNKYVIIITSLIVCTFTAFMLQKVVQQLTKKVGLK